MVCFELAFLNAEVVQRYFAEIDDKPRCSVLLPLDVEDLHTLAFTSPKDGE